MRRWAVPVLDAVMEGGWIAVFDAALAAAAGSVALGPFPFALAAFVSLVVTRLAPGRRTTYALLTAVYAAAFVACGLLAGGLSGWSGQRPIGPDGAPVVFAQFAAMLGALAVFRGSRHQEVVDDDLVVGSVLRWGFPALAIPWLFGSQLPEVQRVTFAAAAFPATLVFAATGLLALGIARLDSLAMLSGVSWHRNRAWLALLGAVLGIMLLIAVPAAFLLGTPVVALFGAMLGPLTVLLTPITLVLEAVLGLLLTLLTPIFDFLMSLVRSHAQDQQQITGGSGPLQPPLPDQGEPSSTAVFILIAIAVVIGIAVFAVILRLTYRPRVPEEAPPDAPLEEHEFRLPEMTFRRPRVARPHRRPRPATASAAYLAFLADAAGEPDLARRPHEPPATHAARLRSAGFAHPAAALLAADYELERYALRPVTARETARALRRHERLRELLRRHRPAG